MDSPTLPWSTAWAIARRDLSARFRGLRLLLACLFLGVGAIAATGTLTTSISRELASRGREILGGDIEVSVWQRAATPAELSAFSALGKVSAGTRLQAMASTPSGTAPVELKAVDDAWPLVGHLTLASGLQVGAPPPTSAWLSSGAAERLGVKPGERFRLGPLQLTAAGIIADEPDRLSEGFALGPTVIVRGDVPAQAGLTEPGSMFRSRYRIAFTSPHDPDAVAKALTRQFPSAGFEIRTRDKAAPGTERFVTRMGEFLVLVGLAALAIAGIGIGLGVSSYLEARRGSIATLKVLGATSGDITRIYALQLGCAALAGSLAGIAAGVAVTPIVTSALSGLLPVTPGFVLAPRALLTALAYGLLVAFVFTAVPLARARHFPALALMRERVSPLALDWRLVALPVGAGLAAIAAIAMASAAQPLLSAGFLGGTAALLALLGVLGLGVRRLAARLRPHGFLIRTALANLHRPGAQTQALVTALGFGLTAFVALAGVESALDANIAARVPRQAPDYFVLDVPRDRVADFTRAVLAEAPQAKVRTVPSLRGAILAYGTTEHMIRTSDLKEIPDKAWPLRGERGLTYAEDLPEGNTLTAGKWWPRNYNGPPLVSIDEKLADALNLKLGDRLTVGLLGVERTATIASFRRIDWDSMGFNYVLVFSPNAIADAPHNLAATISLPAGAKHGLLLRRLTQAFPSSSVVETGPLLRDARAILSQMSMAILAAASIAVLAGIAVLLGAIAAARASRLYDNAILRVLGASTRQLLVLQLGEYMLLATLLALVALGLGSAIAFGVVAWLFDFDWLPDWGIVLATLGAGLVLVLSFALGASLPLLRARPAAVLREL